MEFKGTKGKWEAYDKLISKAPEMLEMLKYFTDFPDSDFEGNFTNEFFYMTVMCKKIKQAKELIKEATEGTPPNQYDYLLISKAPEMLRLLKDTYLHIDALSRRMKDPTYSQGMKGRAEEIKQLIKEATTL